MTQVEHVPAPMAAGPLALPFTVAAWNLERCYFPEESATLLDNHDPAVILLSEVDNGMARTGQQHTTAVMAQNLGAGFAYGVEFLELDLGSARERNYCRDDFNAKGFHGNALLARQGLCDPFLVRLDDHGHWFDGTLNEKRVGGRCAIGSAVNTQARAILFVSVHLESHATPDHRAAQMRLLLDCIDMRAGSFPVVIGGDLNSGVRNGARLEDETLFADAALRGYAAHGAEPGQTTVRKSRLSDPDLPYRIDWFLTRGIKTANFEIVPALAPDGTPLSDHELVKIDICAIPG